MKSILPRSILDKFGLIGDPVAMESCAPYISTRLPGIGSQPSAQEDYPIDEDLRKSTVRVWLDPEMRARLKDEFVTMGDLSIDDTIRRRLTLGLDMAVTRDPQKLRWRPVHRDSLSFDVTILATDFEALTFAAEECGYGLDVLTSTLLFEPSCKPASVLMVEESMTGDPPKKYEPIRREQGRGNIYKAEFELAGYELVFIRMLANRYVPRDKVIGEALIALARQALSRGGVATVTLTGEAQAMAMKMVALAAPRGNT